MGGTASSLRCFFWVVFYTRRCGLLDGFLAHLSVRGQAKVVVFDSFFVTLGGPGTHARTVLPLQRKLDLEGLGGQSGGSE